MEANGSIDPIGTRPVVPIQSPIFGRCYLIRHSTDDVPNVLIGYVETEDRPGDVVIAIRHNDRWCNRNLKPLKSAVVAWYSMENADGATMFER